MSLLDAAWPAAGDPERAALALSRWQDRAAQETDPELADFSRGLAGSPGGAALLTAVFGGSPYLTELALRDAAALRRTITEGPDAAMAAALTAITEAGSESDTVRLMAMLRRAKRQAALAIALADIAGLWPLERVTGALSDLAETALEIAIGHLLARAAARGALAPEAAADPSASGLIVLGMGKLGARELNYSSDIDLIVLYDEERVRSERRDELGHTFVRLTRDLVRVMEERTVEGYVFRTDLRLRPDPGATPPAVAVTAAETYYTSLAQNWERAAMIKARPVAGDRTAGQDFLDFLKPFIWRRSLDFAAIQDIHAIRRQIRAHHGHGAVAVEGHDLKLGRGGIREIEFFVQTQQLVFGGRDARLRVKGTLPGLEALVGAGRVDPATAATLADAYRFLRRTEHRVQMVDDRQTHSLPADPAGFASLARFLGHADAEGLRAAVRATLNGVEACYARLFEAEPAAGGPALVFAGADDHPATLATLAELGYARQSEAAAIVRGWLVGRHRALRSERARNLLSGFLPTLLAALGRTPNPDATLVRFDEFLSRLPAGVQLLSLFQANPGLLDLVAEILGGAGRLADLLARDPAQLDAVLTPGFFGAPGRAALAEDLAVRLAPARDFEDVLDLLRRWTNDQRFRAGVHVLRRITDGARCGRFLSDVAELALDALHARVEAAFARRHGGFGRGGLAIVALGKLGGREMSIRSDLDLIMMYDAPPEMEDSDGEKPLPATVYYTRLIQRLTSAITAPTTEGALFEVDMRLRPSGRAGPLATSLASFVAYQKSDAWTWEHMALTRARVIAGDERLRGAIEAAIAAVLRTRRDPERLRRDVADMRARIAAQHPGDDVWDVKYLRGGLIDIEFVAQYLQLRHAAERPEVLHPTTAVALSRLAAAGALAPDDAAFLTAALHLWQRLQAFLRLTVDGRFDPTAAAPALAEGLLRAAAPDPGDPPLLGAIADLDQLADALREVAAKSHSVFRRLAVDDAVAWDGSSIGEANTA